MAQSDELIDKSRIALVILGMHRSGTSALAGVLARLGAEPARDLIEPSAMNPKGFYESQSITELNDDILKSAGSYWYTWEKFNADWHHSPEAIVHRAIAIDKFKAAFQTSSFISMKDPRMCILMPFWDDILHELGYQKKFVHTLREPQEVIQSLYNWAGYDPTYGELLWLRYMLEAEAFTRGKARVFISYQHLIANWQAATDSISETLGFVWPRQSHSVKRDINAFLDASLNNMRKKIRDQGEVKRTSNWISEVHEIFKCWAETGEKEKDYKRLDVIATAFNTATPFFSDAIEAGRRDNFKLQMNAKDAKTKESEFSNIQVRLEHEKQDLQTKMQDLQAEMQNLQTEKQDLKAEMQHLKSAYYQAQTTINELIVKAQDVSDELQGHRLQAEVLKNLRIARVRDRKKLEIDLIEALRKKQSLHNARVKTLEKELATTEKELATTEHQVKLIYQSRSWKITKIFRDVANMVRRMLSISKSTTNLFGK